MPRTCTTAERNAIKAAGVNHYLYLFVADADGTLRDCSALGTLSLDLLDGSKWGETLDTPVTSGTLTICRETNDDTASPLMGASSINRNALAEYAPLFEKGRTFVLKTATVGVGVTPSSSDKKEMLTGRIDAVHWHASPMTIDVSDLGAWVMDAFIQAPRQYITVAAPGAGPLLGAIIQSMLDDVSNVPIKTGPITLYEPVASTFQPQPASPTDVQQPGALLTAIRTLAQEIGWECRYRYDASDVSRLTLYEPNRANVTADWVIGPSEYRNVTNLTTSIADIRNYIRGIYSVQSAGANANVVTSPPTPDSASITKYGVRFMQVNSTLITNATDMQALTDAILSDLDESPADQEIEMPYFWPVQIGDLITFQANGVHYDTDQTLAVVGYTHSFANGEGSTTIQGRGKVAGAYRAWLRRQTNLGDPGADDPTHSILRVVPSESADGTARILTLSLGALVETVHVHYRTVTIDATGDVFDFSGNEDVSEGAELKILKRVSGTNVVSTSFPHPPRGFKIACRLVPRSGSPDFFEGASWPIQVDAAPPAINAKLVGTRVGAVGAYTIGVTAGPSDWPVEVDVYLDTLAGETRIATTTLTAPATLDGGSFPGLSNIALPPGKDSVALRVVVIDCSGQDWDFGPALLNRDPLPQGTVTVGNYRAAPVFSISYDPDTDSVIYTAHNGKTKTWNRAALDLAGSVVTYIVGVTALDDASLEPALIVDETRSGAHVDSVGGGTTVANVWAGDLHGQPRNPPTVKVDVEPVGDGDTVNVFGTPDTQVSEQLNVHYRLGITDAALEYLMCVGASDPTPLAVIAGTRIGPSNFFRRVDGVGSPTALLAGISLTHDQIDVHQMQAIGVASGMPSAWTNVQLSLLPLPLLEAIGPKFDPATNTLSALVSAGARMGSVGVEFADNEAFSAPITASGDVSDGNQLVLSTTLSLDQLGKPWHIRGTPFTLPSLGGLVGKQQVTSINVPAIIGDLQFTSVESGGNATLTFSVDDKGGYLKQTYTNGTVTGALTAIIIALGVSTPTNLTHSVVGTVHTWVLVVALDPLHPKIVQIYDHFIDDSGGLMLSTSVDSNKISDLADSNIVDAGANAAVTLSWDTDTLIGSNCARYSLDGATTWTTVTVSSLLLSQFNVTRAAATQSMLVQAKNALDGAWGDQSTLSIPSYAATTPIFDVHSVEGTTTTQVFWSCTQGTATLSIDGATPSTPPASPITVARPAKLGKKLNYAFAFTSGGVTVTDSENILPLDSDTVPVNVDVTMGVPTATTVPFTVTGSNAQTGAAVNVSVTCTGCTMTIGGTTYPDGTTQSVSSSTLVTANRPSSTTTTLGHVKVTDSLGSATESIVVPVTPQLNLGPSLTAHYESLGASSGQVVWSCPNGTVTLKVDNGSAATPSASPIAVSLDATQHSYLFEAVIDGQTVSAPVTVPAAGSGSFTFTIGAPTAGPSGGPYTTLSLPFTASGFPTGTTFDAAYNNGGANVDSKTGQTSTPITFTGVTFNGSPGGGAVTMSAQYAGKTLATRTTNGVYAF